MFKAKRRGDVAVIDDLCQLPPRHNIQILCIHSSLVAGEPPPVLAAHETLVRGVPLKEGVLFGGLKVHLINNQMVLEKLVLLMF